VSGSRCPGVHQAVISPMAGPVGGLAATPGRAVPTHPLPCRYIGKAAFSLGEFEKVCSSASSTLLL
jgi:hypothetical protein